MRTAFRKRECARVSKVGEKGEGVGINGQAKTLRVWQETFLPDREIHSFLQFIFHRIASRRKMFFT
jgi:hypothetical protein